MLHCTETYYAAQCKLKLMAILILQPSKSWHGWCEPPHLSRGLFKFGEWIGTNFTTLNFLQLSSNVQLYFFFYAMQLLSVFLGIVQRCGRRGIYV